MNDKRATIMGIKRRKIALCPESGKRQYRTRRKALRSNGGSKILFRRAADAYICRHCGFWHITRPR